MVNRSITATLPAGSVFAGNRTMVGARGEGCLENERKVSDAILVIEDEVLVRMAIVEDLRDAGYTVIEASTAHEALELLRSNSVDVRLVFSDVLMPGTMDGVALAHTIRFEFPQSHVDFG